MKNVMKILVIITSPLHLSGITLNILSYYEAMDRDNVQVDFINAVACDGKIRERIDRLGSRIFDLTMRNRNPVKYILALRKIVKNGGYNIVHAHGSSGMLGFEMLAARLGGAKVRIAHSRNTLSGHALMDKLTRPLLYFNCNVRFACGEDAGRWLFKKRGFKVIPNGKKLDSYLFDSQIRDEYRKKYSLQDNFVIGHVGLFNEQKNHDFLIEIFREIVKRDGGARLVLVGEGDKRPAVEQKIRGYGLTNYVIFTGKISDVHNLNKAFDITIFPSLYEGLPNVVLEWQLAGLPCVVSDVITKECCFTDLVSFLSLRDSAERWAEHALSIKLPDREAECPDILKKANSAGYNIEENAKMLKALYENLLKERGTYA